MSADTTPEPRQPAPPPKAFVLYWCDGCGVCKAYNPFKHYIFGKRCLGQFHAIRYSLNPDEEGD